MYWTVYHKVIKKPPLNGYDFAVNLIGCNRAFQYDLALKSLDIAAKASHKVIVFASVDCNDQGTIDVVKKWQYNTSSNIRVVYLESYQMHTHKQPARLDERVARHWLSANNRIFSLGFYDDVIYLESDHIVAPDFFDATKSLLSHPLSKDFFMLNLGCHGRCHGKISNDPSTITVYPLQNIGVIYRRQGWEDFINNRIDDFCSMYGDWDYNLHTVLGHNSRSLGYTMPRVKHTTTCYTSRRHYDHGCEDPDNLHQKEFDEFIKKKPRRMRHQLNLVGEDSKKMTGSIKHDADQETKKLCLEASRQVI